MTNVNPGNGNRDEYVDAEYIGDTEEYRGSHRRGDDGDYDAEDDGDYAAPVGGSTAAAAGGIPKRGLAMILIAVAAILLLWGLYALTQKDNAGTDAASTGSSATTATATAPVQNPQNPQNQQNPQGTAQDGQPAQGSQPPAENSAAPAPSPAPAPAPNQGQAPALTAQNAQVFVYNNSANPGVAGTTADQLAPQYTVANKSTDSTSMNLPEQTYGIFPETTVFYDPSVNGAEQVAADLARQVGGVAKPNNEVPQGASLPDEVRGKREAVSVVLAG
ncbi:LytR C-terminal domain-containing protein [Corynebacterium qintianiae]|uniref:LytR C-terminal domain-containing protein n=1 Tax=Corynebacterium qintianiae TaxID=2709392 RepID=UPI0013EBE955|nr:LytR C-terminal domain-containing protein [Corynebacterium qintianiae]